eukprot:scaffold2329_cov247-Pinguiococcus_pyrenoidosus.AAC.11
MIRVRAPFQGAAHSTSEVGSPLSKAAESSETAPCGDRRKGRPHFGVASAKARSACPSSARTGLSSRGKTLSPKIEQEAYDRVAEDIALDASTARKMSGSRNLIRAFAQSTNRRYPSVAVTLTCISPCLANPSESLLSDDCAQEAVTSSNAFHNSSIVGGSRSRSRSRRKVWTKSHKVSIAIPFARERELFRGALVAADSDCSDGSSRMPGRKSMVPSSSPVPCASRSRPSRASSSLARTA